MREGPLDGPRRRQAGDRRGQGSCRSAIASAARCSRSPSPTWRPSATSAITSATFFTAQIDFTHAGDLQVFVDEAAACQRSSSRWPNAAISKAARWPTVFNLMRSNDLIWPYVINNYLKGKAPFPFDLLYWNSDSTRMPAGEPLLLSARLLHREPADQGRDGGRRRQARSQDQVTVPIYELATREDHIAPAKSVVARLVLLRRAGQVRARRLGPHRRRRQPAGQAEVSALDRAASRPAAISRHGSPSAQEHPGSWWPDWAAWIKSHDPTEVDGARSRAAACCTPIEDAPGSYVKVRD